MSTFTIQFRAMGSGIQAWLSAPTAEHADVLKLVPDWFATWEAIFSRFRPESELSQFNRYAGGWVSVSSEFFEVVALARQAAEITDGLFNPLILNALEATGYSHDFNIAHGQDFAPTPSTPAPDWKGIDLDRVRGWVRIPAGARLDLGGIVKGWAARQTADRLSASGPCLVDAAGDMMAIGSPDESGGWWVSVGDHRQILLKNSGIATSGTDYRRWQYDGAQYHHLIDPTSGAPSTSRVRSATVCAPDSVQAEIWAKAVLLGDGLHATFPVFLTYEDGATRQNPPWEALQWKTNL